MSLAEWLALWWASPSEEELNAGAEALGVAPPTAKGGPATFTAGLGASVGEAVGSVVSAVLTVVLVGCGVLAAVYIGALYLPRMIGGGR